MGIHSIHNKEEKRFKVNKKVSLVRILKQMCASRELKQLEANGKVW